MTEPPAAAITNRGSEEVRRGRRHMIAAQLASASLSADDRTVLDASASDVADHLAAADVGDG